MFDNTFCSGPGYKDQPIPSPDENMFNTADSLFSTGNYTNAKILFKSLIEEYPDSRFAEAAMKDLFSLEQFAGNNYAGLKQYYLTNDSITADTNLEQLGEFMANRCDVKMHNWPQAINWYENRILNPPSNADSICAIIDLGEIYLLMENGGEKSTYTGKLPQYKPSSESHYRSYRESLLSLLPFKHKTKPLPDPLASHSMNELMQNNPNPFSTWTDIWYYLGPNTTQATLTINNCTGQICRRISLSDLTEGAHKYSLDASGLHAGIYFYSLDVSGQRTDTKKMVVMR